LNRALLLVDARPQVQQSNADELTRHDGRRNVRATYQHGYYFAREIQSREHTQDDHADPQTQGHYYKVLLKRYRALRSSLSEYPIIEPQTIQQDKDEPPKNRHEWLYVLNREYPTPVQIAKLDDHNVARGLKYCAHGMERSDAISKQKSCWIWALLAKAGEVDTMLSERISPIRDLAIKAGQLSIQLRNVEAQRLETDHEYEDAEDWVVDNVEPDYEGSEHSSDGESELLNADSKILELDIEQPDEEGKLLANGIESRKEATKSPEINAKNEHKLKQDDSTDSGADMSMSEDGEIQDDEEPATLEEARARLFAQLGDRLVQPQANTIPQAQQGGKVYSQESPGKVKSSTLPSASSASSARGGRHKHNGKFCHDPSCAVEERRRLAHQSAGRRSAQGHRKKSPSPSERPLPSRAEAEAQRQAMRKQELSHVEPKIDVEPSNAWVSLDGSSDIGNADEALKPVQKVFSSRAEAEDYRKAQRELGPSRSSKTAPELAIQDQVEMETVDIPDLNTRVTIDMILTIAAECYGQKDLLKYRDSWAR
jgi:hypothetical protein